MFEAGQLGLPRLLEVFTKQRRTPVDVLFYAIVYYFDEVGVWLDNRVRA